MWFVIYLLPTGKIEADNYHKIAMKVYLIQLL